MSPQQSSVVDAISVSDLTTYPEVVSILGNGQGFFTEKPQFG
jgi:hypothetical protein